MTTWADRLLPEIILTSPNGDEFTALYRGNSRDVEKKLGIFEFPLLSGAVVQDLDLRAVRHPLTFYFEGPDHDISADLFFYACRQRGLWTIQHPVLGIYKWQLIYVRQEIQPLESGNVSEIKSEWIEGLDAFVSVSPRQRVAAVRERIETLQSTAAEQLNDTVKLDKPSLLTQFRNTVTKITDAVDRALAPIKQTVAEVNAAMESVHRGITQLIVDPAMSVLSLAGQLQSMVTLPSMIVGSITARLGYYGNLLSGIFESEDDPGVNTLATHELVGTSVLAAAANVVISSEPTTREEALEILETVQQLFADLTTGLDAGQSQHAGQYYSQSSSYNDATLLVAEVSALLLRNLFDLAAVKRITLARNRAPVEIALTEGVDLDVLIASNQLSGNDILLLPAGREVVVYL